LALPPPPAPPQTNIASIALNRSIASVKQEPGRSRTATTGSAQELRRVRLPPLLKSMFCGCYRCISLSCTAPSNTSKQSNPNISAAVTPRTLDNITPLGETVTQQSITPSPVAKSENDGHVAPLARTVGSLRGTRVIPYEPTKRFVICAILLVFVAVGVTIGVSIGTS